MGWTRFTVDFKRYIDCSATEESLSSDNEVGIIDSDAIASR